MFLGAQHLHVFSPQQRPQEAIESLCLTKKRARRGNKQINMGHLFRLLLDPRDLLSTVSVANRERWADGKRSDPTPPKLVVLFAGEQAPGRQVGAKL